MTLAQAALDSVMLGRWQFGITTVYHFVLVPLNIGLALLVALMQTFWHKTGKQEWLHATRFFGKLLIISFALGVSTGIVQEFQFGMNWSEYSRYVGDIFGAPLAVEALLAFFMESTFLGLWIFGFGRLKKGMHLATIWLVAIGTAVSAAWILGANSWMQHPVGAKYDPEAGRAVLDGSMSFFKLLVNPVLIWEYTHVITTAWLAAGSLVAGISIWWMVRAQREGSEEATSQAKNVWHPVARFGLIVMIIGALGVMGTGHFQGQELVKLQPMKMAVAEGICVDTDGAAFTVAQFGSCPLDSSGEAPTKFIEIPGVASFMSHNDFSATSAGVADEQARMVKLLNSSADFTAKYGDAAQYNFVPPQMATFWSFRLMIGLGILSLFFALWGLWVTRKGNVPGSKSLSTMALVNLPLPFLAASFGWIFTEIGRQPWVVVPNIAGLSNGDPVGSVMLMTDTGISTAVPAGQVLATLIGFTLLYALLGVIWFLLMRRYVREGIHTAKKTETDAPAGDLSFGY